MIIPEKTFVTINPYFQVRDTFHKITLQVEKYSSISEFKSLSLLELSI